MDIPKIFLLLRNRIQYPTGVSAACIAASVGPIGFADIAYWLRANAFFIIMYSGDAGLAYLRRWARSVVSEKGCDQIKERGAFLLFFPPPILENNLLAMRTGWRVAAPNWTSLPPQGFEKDT